MDNALGQFLYVDEQSPTSQDKCVGKLLVQIDVSQGLLEELEIQWRGISIVQKLDYWKVLFRCLISRRIRHLKDSCPFDGFSEATDEEEAVVEGSRARIHLERVVQTKVGSSRVGPSFNPPPLHILNNLACQ